MTAGVPVAVDVGQSGVRVRAGGRPGIRELDGLGRFDGDVVAGLSMRIREAWGEPGSPPLGIGRLVVGLTVEPADQAGSRALARDLGTALGAQRVDVCGDDVTAHAGALAGRAGVVLTVGTGVACLGLDPRSGIRRRVDGDGFLLGDVGGAFWLGSRGISAVLRARDGRGGPTALADAADARYGPRSDLAAWLHGRPRAVAEIARFAVDVHAAALEGDAVAVALVATAADELLASARAASAPLGVAPCPLALSGRVVGPGSALRGALEERLARQDGLELVEALGGPLDGAWALASGSLDETYSDHLTTWRMT